MTGALLLPREHLEQATDEELDWYIDYLASHLDVGSEGEGPWTLQPRQQVAQDALAGLDPAMSHELLYGGAAGGGKTDLLLWHHYNNAQRYPGYKGLHMRRTFPELRRSAVIRSLERFDRSKCRYTVTENTWKFGNGSMIEFGYCEVDDDVYQYQSAEYDCISFDELTQWAGPYAYLYMLSRCRSRASMYARGFVPHVLAATNPGNVGGGWVKARWVDIGPPEERVVIETDPDFLPGVFGTRIFIPAKITDNRFINANAYRANLAHLPAGVREALMVGSWDVIEGQYFDEWNRDFHVIEPRVLPAWWARTVGIDYGHAAPWCALFGAFDENGDGYVYREFYKKGLTPTQQAQMLLAGLVPGERITRWVIDPSTFARTGAGVPIAQQYVDAGVPVGRAMNDRLGGWSRVREFLRLREVTDGVNAAVLRPRLYIFKTCVELIRTLPMQVHDRNRPEDLDTDGEDHAPDALRYLLMTRPGRSVPPKKEPRTLEERMAARHRDRQAERDGRRSVEHPLLGRI